MRKTVMLAAAWLVLAPLAAAAQSAVDEPVFSASEVRAHVEFLADDLLEGRDNGTRGFDIAARYVATRFDAMGLRPGGTEGWYQPVNRIDYSLDTDAPPELGVGSKKFANGGDLAIGPSPRFGSERQTVAAGAVFVGYGREEDYAGLDVRGKFVVAFATLPEPAPSPPPARLDVAAGHGAVGMLYLVTPEDQKGKIDWERVVAAQLESRQQWQEPDAPNGLQIGAYVKGAVAEALFKGASQSAAQLYAAAAAGTPVKGFALAPRVTAARTSSVEIAKSENVIGILPGSDPALAGEYVVLSAHLDHEGVDMMADPGADAIHNGAMDNAAGVATMLEAARAFTQGGKRPRRSILFVALTAEEDGLIGSSYLARHPVVGKGKVVADVNLDMPILLYDFQDVVAFGAEHSTLGPIVARAAAKMGVTLSPDPMPEEQLFLRSDHYSFVKAGVPSVFLVTGFKNGGEKAFRDFLANHYHKVSDDLNQPFDWAAGAKFARINYLIAREIADAPEAPRWYEGNVYGNRYAKDAPKAPRAENAPSPAAAK